MGIYKNLLSTVANTAIVTMQDILNLGNDARMNTPSTLGGNWEWRLKSMDLLSDSLSSKLLEITNIYSR